MINSTNTYKLVYICFLDNISMAEKKWINLQTNEFYLRKSYQLLPLRISLYKEKIYPYSKIHFVFEEKLKRIQNEEWIYVDKKELSIYHPTVRNLLGLETRPTSVFLADDDD